MTMLNSGGGALVYSSYLGGTGNDAGFAIAVDSSGAILLAGQTGSPDFPVANPFQRVYGGEVDAFVVRISQP